MMMKRLLTLACLIATPICAAEATKPPGQITITDTDTAGGWSAEVALLREGAAVMAKQGQQKMSDIFARRADAIQAQISAKAEPAPAAAKK